MGFGYGYGFDPTFIVLLPAILFSLYAQMKVNSTFFQITHLISAFVIAGYNLSDSLIFEL